MNQPSRLFIIGPQFLLVCRPYGARIPVNTRKRNVMRAIPIQDHVRMWNQCIFRSKIRHQEFARKSLKTYMDLGYKSPLKSINIKRQPLIITKMKYVLKKSMEDLFGKSFSDKQVALFYGLIFTVSALTFILPAFF